MNDPSAPRVYLVGAGPGDPGLLTLRAVECLARADLVIYDKLVPRRLLDFANPAAEIQWVGNLPGEHAERWPQIVQIMLDAARQGRTVVRLKGGDPLVFGRGLEEAAALNAAGIPYEIVAGVTAAVAAAAYAEIPLTDRKLASAVAFVTGHEDPTKPKPGLDWEALARFPGTLAIYMGMANLEPIVRVLLEYGQRPDTPAAVVTSASLGGQQRVQSTLVKLPGAVVEAGLSAPAVILIGPAVGATAARSWYEARPLFGKRVLVTRPRHQASDFIRCLEVFGAVPYALPTVDIQPLEDWSHVDDCLTRLGTFDWLVFTSANGVRAFLGRLRQTGRDVRKLGSLRIAAIGPGTADALSGFHLNADLVPDNFRSERLAEMLAERAAGRRILLARADRGRDVLPTELSKVAVVEQVTVYRQVNAAFGETEAGAALRRGEIDYVTLTSSNIARAFLQSLDAKSQVRVRSGEVQLVTISPVTSATVSELGYKAAAEAAEYTSEGLLRAVVELAGKAETDEPPTANGEGPAAPESE